jgi:hypothetical protein
MPFIKDFSTASVGPIMNLNSRNPSVPEALYQWIAHAFEATESAKDPAFEEPATDQSEWPLTFMDMKHDHRYKLYNLWNIQ